MPSKGYFNSWVKHPLREVPHIWNRLPSHWKAALGEAWEAYRNGSVPIGAVIVDPQGAIVSKGRSRQLEHSGEPGTVYGNPLSHAELNALLTLDYSRVQQRECVLYSTVEPCPLCMGAAYMAGIRRIQYASRDFWAGSANMLGTTPYLSMKPVTCMLSDDAELEDAMIALNVEVFCQGRMRRNDELIECYRAHAPSATAHGQKLHASGVLREAAEAGVPMNEALELLRVPR